MGSLNDFTTDPAIILHLVTLICFQMITGQMLHASGKFVPGILNFLFTVNKLSSEQEELLLRYQKSVVKLLKIKPDENEERSIIKKELEESTPLLKEVPLQLKI